MNTSNVIFLIELLKKCTIGEEDSLKEIYFKTISESDEYINLSNNLENNMFLGVIGKSILDEGNRFIKKLHDYPNNILDLLKEIQQFNELIDSDIKKGINRIEYPGGFLEEINIVPKNKIKLYDLFFTQLASVITYIIALEEGFEGLKNLFWQHDSGLTYKIHNVNNAFIPKLLDLNNNMQPWVIYKTINKNTIKFCSYEYRYKNISSEQYDELSGKDDYKELMPFKFGNTRLFNEDVVDVPIYLGKGFFVSCDPIDAINMLDTGIVTTPLNPNDTITHRKAPFLDELLDIISYHKYCVISPLKITSILNQWDNSYYISNNRKKHKCLICGENLFCGLVCKSHFNFQ